MIFYSPRRMQLIANLCNAAKARKSATYRKEIDMRYKGSCHCGNIAFEVEGDLTGAVACNCSICSRKGSLLWFVPRDNLRLSVRDEENIGTYTFNKHVIKHRFCKACGMHPFGEGTNPNGTQMAAINIRCLQGVDIASVPVQHFDGRAM
jgi:hypothetical protein